MAKDIQGPEHVWLIMIKAMRALTRYAAARIKGNGLGDSDFRVLEVLLHKRPLPVNMIGPIVDLTPGSDQYRRRPPGREMLGQPGRKLPRPTGSYRRAHSTRKGLIIPVFRKHAGRMRRVFSELNSEELRCLEVGFKKAGKRAVALMEQTM